MRKNSKRTLNSREIIRALETHKNDIRKYGVKRMGLFGSFLKRSQRAKSDIDVLVSFSSPTFDNYMELKFMLEKLFRRKIDLVIEENIKPAFKYVKKEAVYVKGL